MTPDDFVRLKAQLTANEGRRSYVYDDATGLRLERGSFLKGNPTWGIGFNADAAPICDAAIDAQYEDRLQALLAEIAQALPWTAKLAAGPMRALIDVAWNTGFDGLIGFHQMLAALNAGDMALAAREVVHSQLAPARAQRLAVLILS